MDFLSYFRVLVLTIKVAMDDHLGVLWLRLQLLLQAYTWAERSSGINNLWLILNLLYHGFLFMCLEFLLDWVAHFICFLLPITCLDVLILSFSNGILTQW